MARAQSWSSTSRGSDRRIGFSVTWPPQGGWPTMASIPLGTSRERSRSSRRPTASGTGDSVEWRALSDALTVPSDRELLTTVRYARRKLAEVGPEHVRADGDFERVSLPNEDC